MVLLVKSLFSGAYKILRNDREQIAVKKGHHDVSLSTDWMSFPWINRDCAIFLKFHRIVYQGYCYFFSNFLEWDFAFLLLESQISWNQGWSNFKFGLFMDINKYIKMSHKGLLLLLYIYTLFLWQKSKLIQYLSRPVATHSNILP